jgi:hypothetical protein
MLDGQYFVATASITKKALKQLLQTSIGDVYSEDIQVFRDWAVDVDIVLQQVEGY